MSHQVILLIIAKGTLFLACALALLTFSFPFYVDIGLLVIVSVAFTQISLVNLLLVSISLGLSLWGIEFYTKKTSQETLSFYREHEKYARDDRYAPNVEDVISMPFGDLYANDRTLPSSVCEPRTVHFKTDSLGFRNNEDYHGQQIVIAGDSFVVGNGTDWKDTLPAILQKEHGIDVYSIGFPHGPSGYVHYAEEFFHKVNKNVRFSFFLYEGNDFDNSEYTQFSDSTRKGKRLVSPETKELLDAYDRWRGLLVREWFPHLHYPLFLFNRLRQLERTYVLQRELTDCHVTLVEGQVLASLSPQSIAAVKHTQTLEMTLPQEIQERTACIFFIPTKFRVYAEYYGYVLDDPPPAFVAMQKLFAGTSIRVIDLTPELRREAKNAATRGEFVFWRDDTHWNGVGMRSVAPLVAQCLQDALE